MHLLNEVFENTVRSGLGLSLTGVKGPVRDKMKKDGFLQKIGEENFFMSIQEAVDKFDGVQSNDNLEPYYMQSNANV